MKQADFISIAVVLTAPPLPPHRVTNWSDDNAALTIKRRTDSFSDKVGVDGRMAVFINADKTGEIGIKVMQTSPTNKYLNAVCRLAQGGASTFAPISMSFMDTYRQDKATGLFGYVKKPADIERGMEVKTQEWTIITERLDVLFGDPIFSAFATAAAEGQG